MPLYAHERAPREGAPSATMVLLHGYGAHEGDLITLAPMLDPRLRAIGLRAPLPLPWGGYAWYPLVPRGTEIDFDPDAVDAAVALAAGEVERIAQEDGRPPILLGFSQGGGIALSIALTRPELCSAVLAMSAVPPMVSAAKRAPRERLRALPVFAAHGTQDAILAPVRGKQTRATLEEAGVALEWHEYPIGHEISPDELADARAFYARLMQ